VKRVFAAAGVVVVGALAIAGSAGATSRAPASNRVLVISMPYVSWRDLNLDALPHLRELFAGSAIGGLSLHGANYSPTLADGYLTINTGARSEAKPASAACVKDGDGALCRATPQLIHHNDRLLFDAHVGLLGDTLAANGVSRTVLAHEPDAALALIDRAGRVPNAPRNLAEVDPAAPTGVSADVDAYARSFTAAWHDRAVVLVEASDLVALESQRRSLPPHAFATYRDAVLHKFDGIVGAVLADVDPARDAVLVVGPAQQPGPFRLEVASLRSGWTQPGSLRSAYTRRLGVVALIDVAPTLLNELGIARPSAMEGRPFEAKHQAASLSARVHSLVRTDDRAFFRDGAITQLGGAFAACSFVLAGAGGLILWRFRRRSIVTAGIEQFSLALLYSLPVSYLAMLFSFAQRNMYAFWTFLVLVSAVAAVVTYWTTNRQGVAPLLVALTAVVGLIVVDVGTGSRLQYNGPFGYSATIGGRFAGLGNLGFAQLAAGAVFLAALLAFRIPGRAGLWLATAVLVLAVVVDGAPFFGADVGGMLAMVPAFGVMAAMLWGWRLRERLVLGWCVAAVVGLAIVAAIDLSRPVDDRTHLGRMLTGHSDIGTTIHRKIAENWDVLAANPFALLLPLVYLGAAYLVWRSPEPLHSVRARIPQLTPALVGFGIVALLGTLLNDSGVTITGVMFGVFVPVMFVLTVRFCEPASLNRMTSGSGTQVGES
jgi:hypothetical protein